MHSSLPHTLLGCLCWQLAKVCEQVEKQEAMQFCSWPAAYISLTQAASDPFTAHSLQNVSTQPALVVTQHFLHAYETPSCLPTHFAVILSMYTLIPTVYRALLKSAVSGIGHRIHTTKKICKGWVTQTCTCVSGARHADFPDADLAEVDDESDFVCPVWNVPEVLGQTDCLLLRSHQ